MPDRDRFICARLSTIQHDAARLTAEANGLKLGEWVRLSVLRRLSGADSVSEGLLRECFAIRLLLLNVLAYFTPEHGGLTPASLQKVWDVADQISEGHARKVLASTSPLADAIATSTTPARSCQTGARLTESQYHSLVMAAEEVHTTPAEWVRNTILTQVNRETLFQIFTQQIGGLRTILDRIAGKPEELTREAVADVAKRTDPSTIRVPQPQRLPADDNSPNRR